MPRPFGRGISAPYLNVIVPDRLLFRVVVLVLVLAGQRRLAIAFSDADFFLIRLAVLGHCARLLLRLDVAGVGRDFITEPVEPVFDPVVSDTRAVIINADKVVLRVDADGRYAAKRIKLLFKLLQVVFAVKVSDNEIGALSRHVLIVLLPLRAGVIRPPSPVGRRVCAGGSILQTGRRAHGFTGPCTRGKRRGAFFPPRLCCPRPLVRCAPIFRSRCG